MQHQARAAHDHVVQLREELATSPTDEFATDGTVKPKTPAAKLFAELQTAERPPVAWERREQDAATKVGTAQRGLNWFVQANVTELVKAREPEDTAINQRIIDAATTSARRSSRRTGSSPRSRSYSCRPGGSTR